MRSETHGRWLGIFAIVALLAACGGPRSTAGGVGGAAAGGVLGGAVGGARGMVVGALLGGLFGAAVGDVLDQRDRRYAELTAYRGLEQGYSGRTLRWENPDTGHYGTFTPMRAYQTDAGYCREYQQTIVVGGRPRRGYGTACRQPDGTWRIMG